MYCKNCGKELKEDDAFCSSCGTAVNGSSNNDENASQKTANYYTNQIYNEPNRNTNKSGFNTFSIVGFVLAFFSGILGLIFSILGYNQAKREGTPTGLALAGIIISIITIILAIVLVIVFMNALYYYIATNPDFYV